MKTEKELVKEFQRIIKAKAHFVALPGRLQLTASDPKNEEDKTHYIATKMTTGFLFVSEGWFYEWRKEKEIGNTHTKDRLLSRSSVIKELTREAVKAAKNGQNIKIITP